MGCYLTSGVVGEANPAQQQLYAHQMLAAYGRMAQRKASTTMKIPVSSSLGRLTQTEIKTPLPGQEPDMRR